MQQKKPKTATYFTDYNTFPNEGFDIPLEATPPNGENMPGRKQKRLKKKRIYQLGVDIPSVNNSQEDVDKLG